MSFSFGAIIVAAGTGSRAGGVTPKQLWELSDCKTVLEHACQPFLDRPDIGKIALVINKDLRQDIECLALSQHDKITLVEGGHTRQASVFQGLSALPVVDQILVHDAARPLLTPETLADLMVHAEDKRGFTLAAPITDTIVRKTQTELATVSRDNLFAVQTPQMFPARLFRDAHHTAMAATKTDFTDDATLMQHYGTPIDIVHGPATNFKVTYAQDLKRAQQMMTDIEHSKTPQLPDIRVGHGYDVHTLTSGQFVTLCGVQIPHTQSLSGHSDADVGLHALTDALLATIGDGDIGAHFPPSDPQWKGAESHIFLDHAAQRVRARNGRITHCDITIICERPKIGPHAHAMKARLSDIIGLDLGRISVKATTHEKIGSIGRMEGICAMATATVVFPEHSA